MYAACIESLKRQIMTVNHDIKYKILKMEREKWMVVGKGGVVRPNISQDYDVRLPVSHGLPM